MLLSWPGEMLPDPQHPADPHGLCSYPVWLLASTKVMVLLTSKASSGQVVCDPEEKLWTMLQASLHMGPRVTSKLSCGQVPSLL